MSAPLAEIDRQRLLQERLLRAGGSRTDAAQAIPRRMAGSNPVLTSLQRQLWFLHQLEPDSVAYSIPVAFRITGSLDAGRLAVAIDRLGRRHEVLRTCYPDTEGEPRAEILDMSCQVDFRVSAPEDIDGHVVAEVGKAFEITREAPMRAVLWRIRADEHVLLLNWHHIAVDGWSVGLLLAQLGQLYAAAVDGMPPASREPELQFGDFAAWRADRINGSTDGILSWRRHLEGAPSLLDVPTDWPRPAVPDTRGRIHRFRLGEETGRAVARLSALCGATPFQVFIAAVALLHARDARQDDVVLGTVVSQRERRVLEDMPGCFVNTLAIRTRIAPGDSARDLIVASRKTMVEMADHMHVPFSELVDAIAPTRSVGRTPIFQVLLSVNSFARRPFGLPGLTVEELPVDTHATKFDLSWSIDDVGGDVPGSLTYDTALFDAPTIERMTSRLGTLLRAMAAAPDEPVWELDLLDRHEHEAQLMLGSGGRPAGGAEPDLVQRFCVQADARPNDPAVRSGESLLSYGELDRASSRIANVLIARGIGAESRVAILLRRGPLMLEALLGVLKTGAAFVPIDPDYPAARIASIVADAGAAHVLSERALAGLAGDTAILLDDDVVIARSSDRRPPYRSHPRGLMYILFTSGSTGRPKGVAIEHGGYANYLSAVLARLDPPSGAQFGLVTTFAADLGTTMTFGALASGGCLHILSRECAADPLAFADYMRSERLDYVKMVPSHFDLLASMSDLTELLPRRCLILAGEGLPSELAQRIARARPDLRLENHYGPTETTVAALTYRVALTSGQAIEPVGRPLSGVRVHVLDDALRPVPFGVPGELFIGGAGVARGYDGRAAATAAAFIPDPFDGEPGARLYATGDLVRMDASGVIHFIGRRDRQVKIRGFRIEIGEIERALSEHADVGEVHVMLRANPHAGGERHLVAYFVGAAGIAPALAGITQARLPDYMRPAAYVALETMPRNANGKLDEAGLPDPAPEGAGATAPDDRGHSPTEARVAAAWSRVLGATAIGLQDDFFRIGGDSFKAVRTVRELGGDVRVMDLFAHPTIAGLAAYLDGIDHADGGVLHRLTAAPSAGAVSWVCVPFGGGSAISYVALAGQVAAHGGALYAVELPGHDYARRDEPLRSFAETVALCVEAIETQVRGPILLYGHCLGAAMATAIGLALEQRGRELAGVMVGGAFPAPRLPGRVFDALSRVLPTDALISARSITDGLLVTGGARGDEDPRELEFLVRNMRHDGREAEAYYTRAYARAEPTRLRAPLLCVVGEMDRATEFHAEEVTEWSRFADHVSLASIPRAGHFFQKHQAADLARLGIDHSSRARDAQTVDETANAIAVARISADAGTVRAFLLTTLGQFVSTIGSGLSTFALGLWIFQHTGVVSDFALLVAVGLLPGILALPFAGAVADRWDRRKVMIAADTTALAMTLVVCILALAGRPPLWSLYLLAAVASVTTAFRQPAYLAAITQLVPKRYLGHATGLVQIGTASGLVLSQVFGGALIALFGLTSILALDVGSFAIAIATLSMVRFPDLMFRRREEPFLVELLQGWRFIVKRPGLVGLMIFFAVGNALASIVLVLVTPIVLAMASSAVLGLVLAANGLGMLVGSLVMALWGGTRERIRGLIGFVALFGISAIVLGLRPSPAFPLAGMFGIGLCTAFINGHWLALIQIKTGTELQGRVLAANQMVARALMPLGTLAAGWLVDRLFAPMLTAGPLARDLGGIIGAGSGRGAALLAILAGLCALGLTAIGLASKPLRRVEQDLPDAIPDPDIADKDSLQAAADARMRSSSVPLRATA